MLATNHPSTCCPAAKYQNAPHLALQTNEKNQETSVPKMILPTEVPLAKVSISAETIIPYAVQEIIDCTAMEI